jgi:hypothetical protein
MSMTISYPCFEQSDCINVSGIYTQQTATYMMSEYVQL